MATFDFRLHRDPFGRLIYTARGGALHTGVVPVRAFPIAAPEEGIALISAKGEELVWIETLEDLPVDSRALIVAELASREFRPEITSILAVSSFATPSTWEVATDRGSTSFVLKGEEDIRRLSGSAMLITDKQGIQFLIRDLNALDNKSRRLLDRFL